MTVGRCPICKSPARHDQNVQNLVYSFDCVRCWAFRCDHYAVIALKRMGWSDQQIGTISGYVRRNSGMFLNSEGVDGLTEVSVPAVAEKAATLLLELGREHPLPGESFWAPVFDVQNAFTKLKKYGAEDDLPCELLSDPQIRGLRWLAVTSAADDRELYWLLFAYLMPQDLIGKGVADGQITISPAGWQEFARLQQVNSSSRIGFVAMSFHDEFKVLYDHGIEPGIRAASYEPLRVDRTEHNNRIDDEIVATIKRSRFLVADFSLNRGGIYFEAGLALGLGIPVIWLVREDQLREVHFDTRQYNFITWSENAWENLRGRLRFRIEATIGRGPVVSRE
jgi:nucleoside 2-deoxyribosyltransferase